MTDILPVWDGDRAPFAKAFIAAQKVTEAVKKAATNPAFKTKYADLSEVVEAVVPALNSHGVAAMQFPAFDGELVHVTTVFLHESGASVTGTLSLRPSKSDPQGVGSAITYARRYSLLAMTGAAPEDDDGNHASGPRQERAPAPPQLSTGARLAINTMETYQRDPDKFREFWTTNKDGLKTNLDPEDYAAVVNAMKRIGESMKAAPASAPKANGQDREAARRAAMDEIADEIPF